jgi:uncharacterized SAM-binding protein YcdF (DUF218 family)
MQIHDEKKVDELAKKLWDYGLMHHRLEKADAIIVFGSYNPVVGVRAAELFQQGYAPIIVFSGNCSDSTLSWQKTEAETMADAAIEAGAPPDKILLETEATNSGDNTRLTRALLERDNIYATRIIVIQKPYAERRTFATVRQQWPEVDVIMSSPQLSYEEYMATSPKGKAGSISTIRWRRATHQDLPGKGFPDSARYPQRCLGSLRGTRRTRLYEMAGLVAQQPLRRVK